MFSPLLKSGAVKKVRAPPPHGAIRAEPPQVTSLSEIEDPLCSSYPPQSIGVPQFLKAKSLEEAPHG